MEQDVARIRRQLAAMTTRIGGAGEQLRDAATKFEAAESDLAQARADYQQHLDLLEAAQREATAVRKSLDEHRMSQATAIQNVARLAHLSTMLESRLHTIRATHDERQTHLSDLHLQRDTLHAQLTERRQSHDSIQSQIEACQDNVRAAESRLASHRQESARVEKQQRHFDARSTRTHERIAVLTELNERLEGLNSGVRDVLMAARNAPDGPLGDVRGVIADLFQVDVDSAPMIDAALGEQAEYLVIQSAGRLFDWLDRNTLGVGGRVGFLRLDARPPIDPADGVDLSDQPGVIGRADQYVETASDLVPLAQRLLGRTWFVDRLATALRLAQTTGRGLSFVTTDGELLTGDGTLVVGPPRLHRPPFPTQRAPCLPTATRRPRTPAPNPASPIHPTRARCRRGSSPARRGPSKAHRIDRQFSPNITTS